MLSNRQQIARLRHLAVQALGAYPLVAPELRFVAHGENTTFRVDAMVAGGRDRFLLRVHRPARHGRRLDSAAAVGSELDWLTALRADTDLSVPEPVRTTNGKLTTVAASPDVPEPRVCSLLRWMDGRVHSSVPRLVHLRRLGSAMARLHNHAGQWCPPPGFARIRWDWETFFGDAMVYGGINAADAWDLLPADLRRKFDRVASGMQRVMTQLGDGADQVGLIHADLHLQPVMANATGLGALFRRAACRLVSEEGVQRVADVPQHPGKVGTERGVNLRGAGVPQSECDVAGSDEVIEMGQASGRQWPVLGVTLDERGTELLVVVPVPQFP